MCNCKAMTDGKIEDLINEYLAQVKKATDLLEYAFGTRNILGLWRTKKISQRGSVSGDVTYELHGIGCRVYISEICIDFDYGPADRVDGFDLWRLFIYACELPEKYKPYTDRKFLEHDFNEYLKLGKAKKIPGAMSSLYFIQP